MGDEKKIVNLSSGSTTTHGDKTATTTHQPKYTTKTEQQVGGFYNPDGTPNLAAKQEFEQGKQQLAAGYHVNPETGRVEPKFITNIVGVDPEIMRQKREEEQKLNRRKAKESALYNALAVIGDIATTAAGGNVWQRKADQHGKEAHDMNLALDREQQAEDIANADKIRGTEQAYAAAVQKLRDTIGNAYKTKLSQTQEIGGDSQTVTKQGQDKTVGWKQEQERRQNINVNTGSGSRNDSVDVGVIKENGDLGTRSIPQEKVKNLLAHAEYVYENAIKGGGHDKLFNHFKQSGIIKDVKYNKNGTIDKIAWNEERLQRSGYLMWGGGDENLNRTIKNYYYEITGSDNPIVPVTGGSGRLSGNKTNIRKKTR